MINEFYDNLNSNTSTLLFLQCNTFLFSYLLQTPWIIYGFFTFYFTVSYYRSFPNVQNFVTIVEVNKILKLESRSEALGKIIEYGYNMIQDHFKYWIGIQIMILFIAMAGSALSNKINEDTDVLESKGSFYNNIVFYIIIISSYISLTYYTEESLHSLDILRTIFYWFIIFSLITIYILTKSKNRRLMRKIAFKNIVTIIICISFIVISWLLWYEHKEILEFLRNKPSLKTEQFIKILNYLRIPETYNFIIHYIDKFQLINTQLFDRYFVSGLLKQSFKISDSLPLPSKLLKNLMIFIVTTPIPPVIMMTIIPAILFTFSLIKNLNLLK